MYISSGRVSVKHHKSSIVIAPKKKERNKTPAHTQNSVKCEEEKPRKIERKKRQILLLLEAIRNY